MIDTTTLLAWAVSAPVAGITAVFAAEVIGGTIGLGLTHRCSSEPRHMVVVIPAHDEEIGLARTLTQVSANLPSGATVLVIADNCTDTTAAIARGMGIEVLERHDPALRGKSYALSFARDHLRKHPPELLIVLDADCSPDPRALTELAEAAHAHAAPVQADNRLRPVSSTQIAQISNFAFFVKNSVRQRGMSRIGDVALLTGTGMAFPWSVIDAIDLATGSIVEDLELGIRLTLQGHAPVFVPSAKVWSDPAPGAATATQRARWEGGYLATSLRQALPVLFQGLMQRRRQLIWLGFHLLVPPLVLLSLLNMAASGLLAGFALTGGEVKPLIALAAVQLVTLGALIAAWCRGGRQYLPPRTLLALPLYVLWKIPLYSRLLRNGTKEWVRTARRDS